MFLDLEKALNGEYSAIACYEQLAKLAPNEEQRNRILEIRNDEIRHYQIISQMYVTMAGKQPAPQLTEPCPTEYKAGLLAAFKDEQETVDFYLGITDQTNIPYVKETFRRIAADEQNHAVWFLYLLMQC
ncbi:ferritin-like domain-containing protein [Cohnella sp. AR92]|uniref:ferritin-like domain-containing protein n=1 Tax=Cohnella sp. AR92 TaxID=648716 RepID=UPI000F8EF823|nr:ferritin-like domain-containing protein [Cohnella sp. AR92]RUS42670.1 ferritin-like domain-containing protein [Cohnella sp. AR92]